jgi:hypothetical protein
MSGMARILGVLCATAALAGCMDRDPYRRTDVWRPTGSNAANIAAMVADPKDMISGRGAGGQSSKPSIVALDRLAIDRPKPLPAPNGATSGGNQGGGGSGGSGGGSGSGG